MWDDKKSDKRIFIAFGVQHTQQYAAFGSNGKFSL